MKSTIKINRYQKCSDSDISLALLAMINPMISACGNQTDLTEIIVELAVTGWNLSLYTNSDEGYLKIINEKLPRTMPEEKRQMLASFTLGIIRKKQTEYGGMQRGITDYQISFSEGEISLELKSLPVHPKNL